MEKMESKEVCIIAAEPFNRKQAADLAYALNTWAADEESIISIKISDSGCCDRILIEAQGDYKEALAELADLIDSEYTIIKIEQ